MCFLPSRSSSTVFLYHTLWVVFFCSDISPQLSFRNVPSDARSLAVVVSDADAEPVVGAAVFHWYVLESTEMVVQKQFDGVHMLQGCRERVIRVFLGIQEGV